MKLLNCHFTIATFLQRNKNTFTLQNNGVDKKGMVQANLLVTTWAVDDDWNYSDYNTAGDIWCLAPLACRTHASNHVRLYYPQQRIQTNFPPLLYYDFQLAPEYIKPLSCGILETIHQDARRVMHSTMANL